LNLSVNPSNPRELLPFSGLPVSWLCFYVQKWALKKGKGHFFSQIAQSEGKGPTPVKPYFAAINGIYA